MNTKIEIIYEIFSYEFDMNKKNKVFLNIKSIEIN